MVDLFGIGGWQVLMGYKIKAVNGHYEIYMNDEFYCSADTYDEALQELGELLERTGD